MLLTVKLMLDWLKENGMATRLESAIARVIAEGNVRTYDMGGNASTLDMAKARPFVRLKRNIDGD